MTSTIENKRESGPVIGIRHLQSFLLFLALTVNMSTRNSIGVALVAMTKGDPNTSDFPIYDWTEPQRSYILSSFYWGCLVTQFPAGLLYKRFGTKKLLCIPALSAAVLSGLTPFCISWGGWVAFCVIRIFLGLFQGLLFCGITYHLAKWCPPEDRNRLGGIVYSGPTCGLVLSMFTSGLIADSSLGWPGIFYIWSGICLFWCVLWLLLASDNAPSSRWISQAECDYIEHSLDRDEGFHKQKIPVPWRAIFTSSCFYALAIASCAQGWASSNMQLQTPEYIHGVLGMDLTSNGMYSALPFLVSWGMTYVYTGFSDVALRRKWMSLDKLRKSINTVATWGPALAMIGIGFLDKEHTEWAIALMTIDVGLNAGSNIGNMLTAIDMSPNHAGIIMSMTNASSTVFGLVAPLVVGVIVTDTSVRSQWQAVFIITACVFFVGNLVYIIWGSNKLQPWDAVDFLKKSDGTIPSIHQDKADIKKQIETIM